MESNEMIPGYDDAFYLKTGDSEIHFKIIKVFLKSGAEIFGGYDTSSYINIKSGDFSARGIAYISTGQLNEFLKQLEKCFKTLLGKAQLTNEYENNLELNLDFDGLGHVKVSGFLQGS